MEYDHIGIPSRSRREGMLYFPEFKVWTSDYEKSLYRIEWIFFEEGNNFHPLIQTIAHVCFIVQDIQQAVRGKKILLPTVHYQDYYMAFIEDDGAPIEFIQKL